MTVFTYIHICIQALCVCIYVCLYVCMYNTCTYVCGPSLEPAAAASLTWTTKPPYEHRSLSRTRELFPDLMSSNLIDNYACMHVCACAAPHWFRSRADLLQPYQGTHAVAITRVLLLRLLIYICTYIHMYVGLANYWSTWNERMYCSAAQLEMVQWSVSSSFSPSLCRSVSLTLRLWFVQR